MAEKVTISFAFDDKVTPRLDVIASRIKAIDQALKKARNFKVNTRSVSTSLDRVNGRLVTISKNLDDIKAKKLFIDTRNTNQKLTGVNTRLTNISTKLGDALGTVKINTGTAQRSLNLMLTKVETIQNALGKTQLNPAKVAAPTAPKSGRATGRDAFAKLRGAFSRTRDPILQVNKALVQFRKEFKAAAKITKGFPGLRTAIKDFTRFEDAIKKIQKANFKNASSSFKAFAQKVKESKKPLTEFVAALMRAEKAAKELEASLKKSVLILRSISRALQIAAKANKNFGKIEKTGSRVGKVFAAIGRRTPLLNKFFGGPKLPLFIDRLRKLRFALVDVRNILKAVGIGAFFEQIRKGIADAANFELLNAQISTLIQGLGPGGAGTRITGALGERFDFEGDERNLEGALEALNRLVRDKAVEAGQDIEKTFKAAYDAISSGVPVDALETFLGQASKLAIGGVADISRATKLLLSVFQTTGRDVDKLADQTDSLFTLVRLGRTTVDELSGSLGRVLPIAQAAGVSVDEVGGAISALSAGGLTTAEAVTALRQVLNKIINPSVASAKLARDLGIQLNTAAIRSKGLKGVLEEIALATKSNTDVIGNLFPRVRALVGVLSLLRGEGTRTLDDFFDPFLDKQGATDVAVDRIKQTFVQTVNELKAGFQSLRAEIFSSLLPTLTDFAARARDLFAGIFDPLRQGADIVDRVKTTLGQRVAAGVVQQGEADAVTEFLDRARASQLQSTLSDFLARLLRLGKLLFDFGAASLKEAILIAFDVVTGANSALRAQLGLVLLELSESLRNLFFDTLGVLGNLLSSAEVGIGNVINKALGIFGDPERTRRAPRAIGTREATSQLSRVVGLPAGPTQVEALSQFLVELRLGIEQGLIGPDSVFASKDFQDALTNPTGLGRFTPTTGFANTLQPLNPGFAQIGGLVRVLEEFLAQARKDADDESKRETLEKRLENFADLTAAGGEKRNAEAAFQAALEAVTSEGFKTLDLRAAINRSDVPQFFKDLVLGLLDETAEQIEATQESETLRLSKSIKDSFSKAFKTINENAGGEFDNLFAGVETLLIERIELLEQGLSQDTSTARDLASIAPAVAGARRSIGFTRPGSPGRANLEGRFQELLDTVLNELAALEVSGAKSSKELRTAVAELNGFGSEVSRVNNFLREQAPLRKAQLLADKDLQETQQLLTQQTNERRQALETSDDVITAVVAELLKLQQLERAFIAIRQAINQAINAAREAQSLSQLNAIGQRFLGGGTRASQIAGLQEGKSVIQGQIDLELQRQEGGLSAGALEESRAKVAAFRVELEQTNLEIAKLEGGFEAFKIGISEAIDNLPTNAQIALDAVTTFAEQTADVLSRTIGQGLKALLNDGIDGLKDGVKQLDQVFAQFFGQLLIDIGTAIIRSILLRTILSALPPGIGGFLGLNRGGPVVGFNDGGTVGGPPNVNRDVVPAMLTPGEFVVRREAVNAVGTEFLMGLNMMGRPSSRIGMSKPRLGSVASFNTGGGVTGLQSGGGASPTYVVANEENLQSLLSGGKNEMLNFLRDNRNNF